MKVRLLDFHCVININDALLGCGYYKISDDRVICHDLLNPIYIALINTHAK